MGVETTIVVFSERSVDEKINLCVHFIINPADIKDPGFYETRTRCQPATASINLQGLVTSPEKKLKTIFGCVGLGGQRGRDGEREARVRDAIQGARGLAGEPAHGEIRRGWLGCGGAWVTEGRLGLFMALP